MTENATASVSCDNSKTIPVSCALHWGPHAFATPRAEKCGEEIVLDVQVTDGCLIILNEIATTTLFDILGTQLGEYADYLRVDPVRVLGSPCGPR